MNTPHNKVNILVVEDEFLLAEDIIDRLTAMNYNIVGHATSAEETLSILDKNPNIDLLLLDIIIKGRLDGIELARIINEKYNLPFIFLTSNADTYMVERAKSVNPYAYMLKPFNDRQVGIAIEMALVNFAENKSAIDFNKEQESNAETNNVLQIKDCLFLKKDHHYNKVFLDAILFIEADNNYSTIYTEKEKYLYSVVMKKVEQQLPANLFMRTHRSFIVNTSRIEGYEGNQLFIGHHRIPISKSHKENVFKLFNTI